MFENVDGPSAASTSEATAFKWPTPYTLLLIIIVAAGVLTYILPSGSYERRYDETIGREVVVPNSYVLTESNPQGPVDWALAPIRGYYDEASGLARGVDVAVFVLAIGAFLGVVNRSGAIDSGMVGAMRAFRGRERWLVPTFLALFAAGGTAYGMSEESLAFLLLLLPLVRAAGYDPIVGVAIVMLGAGVGQMGSTTNPFSTVIASRIAGVPFTQGLELRLLLLVSAWLICAVYLTRYAERGRLARPLADAPPERPGQDAAAAAEANGPSFACRAVLMVFGSTFLALVVGVSALGWGLTEMTGLFVVASLLAGFTARLDEASFWAAFVDGARDLLGVALVVGLARGIVVILEDGAVIDTLLHGLEGATSGQSGPAFLLVSFILLLLLSALIPSTTALAILAMPILGPLADFSGVSRDLVVTAYQSAQGLTNLVNPADMILPAIAIANVSFGQWLRFVGPVLVVLIALAATVLVLAAHVGSP